MEKNTVHHHDPDMPLSLHKAAKLAAMKEGVPLKEWVRLAMEEKLNPLERSEYERKFQS